MKPRMVVLIDDDAEDLETLTSVIREIDPKTFCICFVHADEALQVVGDELKRKPDFIFIDVNMRRKTGAECLAELRQRSEFNSCQIIMFSIVMPATVVDSFKMMGASHAFQKPLVRQAYREILDDILRP